MYSDKKITKRNNQFYALLEDGYIKEVEEPEFTKSDMISLANFIYENHNSDDNETLFHTWKKQSKK